MVNYIECAGVRVPLGWTPQQVADALAKRKIRFHNEKEIMEVFGDALNYKASLEADIVTLQNDIRTLEKRKVTLACPKRKFIPTAKNIAALVQPGK